MLCYTHHIWQKDKQQTQRTKHRDQKRLESELQQSMKNLQQKQQRKESSYNKTPLSQVGFCYTQKKILCVYNTEYEY
jgi:hypothetical protein